jgi:DNA-binding response OmpR family regulator
MPTQLLLIEDDQALTEMLSEYFAGRGITVHAEHTGAKGLAALEKHPYDALLLDVMLPDTDGFEICRTVRAKSDIPILMLTARGDELDRIVGLEIGADDYLPKPFNPRELLARVNAILRRRQGNTQVAGAAGLANNVLRFGRLSIDTASRQVCIDAESRELTAYQFDLLVALAERAGRVLTRDQIMQSLRGHELDAFDRSIDVHISRIRSAIEDDARKPRRIITIRGAGYVFAAEQD